MNFQSNFLKTLMMDVCCNSTNQFIKKQKDMVTYFNAAIPVDYPVAPGSILPSDVAKDMIEAYKNTYNSNGSKTIYVDLDLSKLISFLQRFNGSNGVRIYNGLTATGKHTFIVVPTKKVAANNCRVEFDPIIESDGDQAWAFNFGTLCPPGGNCNCECDGVAPNRLSLARQVYGDLICPPPAPLP